MIATLGELALSPPLVLRWEYEGFPPVVELVGRRFLLSSWAWPAAGVVAQYREDVARGSLHADVHDDGAVTITHADDFNPDRGLLAEHFFADVGAGKVLAAVALPVLALGLVLLAVRAS